jgi:ABC-type multidrug transport system fused ATPase/permease subunit
MKIKIFSQLEILEEIKIIWNYLRKYKKKLYAVSLSTILVIAISVAIPYLYGKLVDLIQIDPPDLWLIFNLLAIWFLMSVVSAFLNRISGQMGSFIGVDASNDLICQASSHLINLPLSFHKKKRVGKILTKIDQAADYLIGITDEVLIWTLPQILAAIFGILILFFIEWKLALGATFLFLGYILITFYKTIPIVENQEKLSQTFEEVYGNLYDSSLNVQVIKSCSAEAFQRRKTSKDYRERLSPVFKNLMFSWESLSFWQNLFLSVSFVILFALALSLLYKNLLTIGGLVMFLGYLNLIRSPLTALGWHWQMFRTGMIAIKRVEKFLEIKPENFKREGEILKEVKGKVEFKNISFGYKNDLLVLKNINFTALPGQKIALVGGSGGGKTTLVDLISLYFKPAQGEILIDDVNIQDFNLHFLRKIIAYVPQEITLFNDTIENNICYGKPEAKKEEIIQATQIANAQEFIELFPQKYQQIVGERGTKLSTGQKQRIAIARAILRDPKILILDEATSSLDSESEKLVQQALERLIKGRTTFIIAHRLSTIKEADKILVLEKGKIVEEGNHQELIEKKGIYFKFFSLQFPRQL